MPFPNEHSARLRDPKDFAPETFRRTNGGTIFGRIKIPQTIGIIWGKLKGRTKPSDFPQPQALRFPIKNWTEQQAKKFLNDNNIKHILFETAEEKSIRAEYIDEIDFNYNSYFSSEFMDEINENINVLDQEFKNQEIEYKTFTFDINETKVEKTENNEIGIFSGSMATEHTDRIGDIIAPEAFEKSLQRYKKAKRRIKLYYQHNPMKVPIGGIDPKNIEKEGKNWKVKGELDFGVNEAREVYSALKNKNLSDLSIGYTIKDADFEGHTRTIKELELWEVSIVGEPMNPKAIITEVKEFKAVTAFKDYPIVKNQEGKPDTKYSWDGNAADKRVRKFVNAENAPNERYKEAHMWFDPNKQDNFTGYKLLYVDVINDQLKVVPRAIFEKAALLKGARRGLNVSEEDKKKIAVHVNKYYDKMGLPSPLRKNINYLFDQEDELKIISNYEIEDVEHIVTQKSFENLLKDSGIFSRQAATYLAKFFNPQKQSESVSSYDLKQSESVEDEESQLTLILEEVIKLNNLMKKIAEN